MADCGEFCDNEERAGLAIAARFLLISGYFA